MVMTQLPKVFIRGTEEALVRCFLLEFVSREFLNKII